MSRRGSEQKLPWSSVPDQVKREAERLLGTPVARGERAYGGYGPSATYRLRLRNGRRAFLKGVHAGSNEFMHVAIDPVVAALAGFFAHHAWRPPIEGLPRLRSIQRRQLKASLAWAARRLDLPEPTWLAGVKD